MRRAAAVKSSVMARSGYGEQPTLPMEATKRCVRLRSPRDPDTSRAREGDGPRGVPGFDGYTYRSSVSGRTLEA